MLEKRKYLKNECIAFRKTSGKYGGLSNMAGGFPIKWGIIEIKSSEALYQSLRYPHEPKIQAKILLQDSPMTAKMYSKKYYSESRADWEIIKFKIMKFCLEMKLIYNWEVFYPLLRSTGKRDIVEFAPNNKVWGAQDKGNYYEGENALGRLLMGLRDNYINNLVPEEIYIPPINDITILSINIRDIKSKIPHHPTLNL